MLLQARDYDEGSIMFVANAKFKFAKLTNEYDDMLKQYKKFEFVFEDEDKIRYTFTRYFKPNISDQDLIKAMKILNDSKESDYVDLDGIFAECGIKSMDE